MIKTKFRALMVSVPTRWLIGACLLGSVASALGQDSNFPAVSDLKDLENRFQEIADRVKPSVVAIRTVLDAETGRPWERAAGQGSGLVIDPNGLILTNEHVVAGARKIKAVLSNRTEHDATLVAADPRRDLAVIKIEAPNLVPVTYADPESIKVGRWALALGNPYGLAVSDGQPSLTVGVVSSVGRNLTHFLEGADEEDRFYGNLIETSTGINPGNSGGPLFDIDGRVMGIVVAVAIRPDIAESFGFATPVTRQVRSIIDTLAQGKTVEYGMIGAKVDDLMHASVMGATFGKGARVAGEPIEGSAAAAAGLQIDDIILEFDNTPIESADHLVDVVGATPVGATVPIRYLRAGSFHTAQITVTRRNFALASSEEVEAGEEVLEGVFQWAGATLRVYAPHGREVRRTGIEVLTVPAGTRPYRAGLRATDSDGKPTVIVSVNGRSVTNVEDFRRGVRAKPNRVSLELSDGSKLLVSF